MNRTIRKRLAAILLAGGGMAFAPPSRAASPPAVPYTDITITGTQGGATTPTATYRAYRNSGERFRILCQEPCSVDPNLIYAEHEGFAAALTQVDALVGIQPLPQLSPFDIHIAGDTWCGSYVTGATGDAGVYPSTSGQTNAFGCYWFVEKQQAGALFVPFTVDTAATVPFQLLTVHEYCHTLFFDMNLNSYSQAEDIVKAISFYVCYGPESYNDNLIPTTDPCDPHLDEIYQGKLIWGLCNLSGFSWADMPPVLQALQDEYLAGHGEEVSGTTSTYQFRELLAQQTGHDTLDAFLGSKAAWVAEIGDTATITPSGGRIALARGAVTLLVPAGAVSSNTTIRLENGSAACGTPPPGAPAIGVLFTGRLALNLSPAVSFHHPVRLIYTYDPFTVFGNPDERTLALYTGGSASACGASTYWTRVADSRVDPTTREISGTISGTGLIGVFATGQAPGTQPSLVLPAVGSLQGGFGATFKTAVRLQSFVNYGNITGKLVFHPAGRSASPSDPSLSFSLPPESAVTYDDLLPAMGQSGLGSLDVDVTSSGPLPVVTARVYNDNGSKGTDGLTEEALSPGSAPRSGDHVYLVVPPELTTQRFNIGIRSLAAGAAISATVRSSSGATVGTRTMSFAPDLFTQDTLANLLPGISFQGGESIDLLVTSGSAVIYGVAVDDVSNDSTAQFPRPYLPANAVAGDTLVVPGAGSVQGGFGSNFRTQFQLFNPAASGISGKVIFHPQGQPAAPGDPSLAFSLGAYQTVSYPDLVGALHASGLGSLDIVTTAGLPPIVACRAFNDGGAEGTTGLGEPALDALDLLEPGDQAYFPIPDDLTNFRMSLGIRTFERGAHLSITVVGENGKYYRTVVRLPLPAGTFQQKDINDWLTSGTALFSQGPVAAGESVFITVDGGSAAIYASVTDDRTNDPNATIARRLNFNYY